MKQLTCIVCPSGCSLLVEGSVDNLTISGNRCPRGALYAQEEICAPKRMVTATCAASAGALKRRVPVRTSAPCPKEEIPRLLADIYNTELALPVHSGDIVIADWNGCGINIIATRSIA